MLFTAQHHFAGSVESVAEKLTSADFYGSLDLPDLSQPTVLEHHDEQDRPMLRLRYEFVGSLDPFARRILGSHRLTWDQSIVVDRRTWDGDLTFAAAADPKRLHGSAHFELRPRRDGCERRLQGEIVVAVPIIGPRAEARIVPGLVRRLDIEASALDAAVRGGG